MSNEVKRIVLIEDDQGLAKVIEYNLLKKDYEFIHIKSGKEAIEFFTSNNIPSLIIIDYELVDHKGTHVIQHLKNKGLNFPFIVITGVGSESVASEFIRLGAYDYVIKDVNFFDNIQKSIERSLLKYNYELKIKEQQHQIIESERRFRLIFDNIQDVFIIMNNRLLVKYISPSVYDLIQIPHTMLINQPILYLLPIKSQWKEAIRKFLKEKVLNNYEIEILNKAKNIHKYCQVNAKQVKIDGQVYAIILLRDITEIKALQKEILTISAKTEEKEKTAISENIHDNIAPIFATSKLYFRRAFETSDENIRKELYNEANNLLDEGINALREVSIDLMSQILSRFGLEKALMHYIAKYEKGTHINILFNYKIKTLRIDSLLENILYRSARELIHNGVKHSNATTICLEISEETSYYQLIYVDDGVGFDFDETLFSLQKDKKQGLYNLIYRLKSIMGQLFIDRLPKGIKITIIIPK